MNSNTSNNIILTSSLLGSVYIFSTSLSIMNKISYNRIIRVPFFLGIINCLSIVASGSIFIYSSIKAIDMIKN